MKSYGKQLVFVENYLAQQNEFEKVESIYKCDGNFKFVESYDDAMKLLCY